MACKIIIALCLMASTARAQYSWPSWTFYRSAQSTGYTMPWVFKPDAVILFPAGGVDKGPSYVQLSTVIQHSGVYKFDWEFYHHADIPYENAEVYFDGVVRALQDNSGHNVQKGTFTTPYLRKGTTIGFRAHEGHRTGGEAVLVISRFIPPVETGECRVEIYPNPTAGRVRLQLGCFDGLRQITVHDMAGRVVYAGSSNQSFVDIDITGASGVYVVRVDNRIFKIIKQ